MKNIIKSLCYEAFRSKALIRITVLYTLVAGLITVLNINEDKGFSGTSGMLAENPDITYLLGILFVGVIIGFLTGQDFGDKVINYEMMSGHSRKSIMLARGVFGAVVTAAVLTLISFVPMLVGNIMSEWGDSLRLSDVVVRQLLFFFPFLRLSAFIICIMFIFKNQYVVMASGYFLIMFVNLVKAFPKSFYSSFSNLELLTSYKGWHIYNIDPAEGIVEYSSFNSNLDFRMVFGTITVSIIMTAFYLMLAYAVFRHDDVS